MILSLFIFMNYSIVHTVAAYGSWIIFCTAVPWYCFRQLCIVKKKKEVFQFLRLFWISFLCVFIEKCILCDFFFICHIGWMYVKHHLAEMQLSYLLSKIKLHWRRKYFICKNPANRNIHAPIILHIPPEEIHETWANMCLFDVSPAQVGENHKPNVCSFWPA